MVAIYARQSVDRKDSISIDSQIEFCNNSKILKRRKRETPRNSEKLDSQLKVIDAKIDNLLEQIALGNSTVVGYINEKIESLEREKKALLQKGQDNMVDDSIDDDEFFQIIRIVSRWHALDPEEKKQVAGQMIERVEITNDSIRTTWKKAFDFI